MLYPELNNLLKRLSNIKGITTISMQSNGLLLSQKIIRILKENGLTRINLSVNTLNEELARYLCNCNDYNLNTLLMNIHYLLESKINVLLAPVWFPGENDNDIEDIINLILQIRKEGYSKQEIQIGIQKYLIYKTGRKLKKIRPKSWDYFYMQLTKLEKKYNIKLKLGPNDFGIHKRVSSTSLKFQKGEFTRIQIISKGRWKNECIGKLNDELGIKIILKKPLIFNEKLVGTSVIAKIIKANYKENITTALYPYK
jgi:uncharacterized Fe-S cluster-containing radical SAM superfamily enzyme